MDSNLLKDIVYIIMTVLTGSAVFGIGYFINYEKKKNPKGLSMVSVVAKIVINYFKANPQLLADSKEIATVIYQEFVGFMMANIKGLTADEINNLFMSVVDVIANGLGIPITEFNDEKMALAKAKAVVK